MKFNTTFQEGLPIAPFGRTHQNVTKDNEEWQRGEDGTYTLKESCEVIRTCKCIVSPNGNYGLFNIFAGDTVQYQIQIVNGKKVYKVYRIHIPRFKTLEELEHYLKDKQLSKFVIIPNWDTFRVYFKDKWYNF